MFPEDEASLGVAREDLGEAGTVNYRQEILVMDGDSPCTGNS